MSLEAIKQEITAAAEKEAATIMAEAEAESKKILAAAETEVASYQEELLEKAHQEAEAIKERGQAAARLEENRKLLALKQTIINRLYAEVLEKIKNLSQEEYEKLLRAALTNLKELKGTFVPVVGRQASSHQVLKDLDLEQHFKFSEHSLDSAGGFLLKGKTFDIEATFETHLNRMKSGLEKEILRRLFYEKETD